MTDDIVAYSKIQELENVLHKVNLHEVLTAVISDMYDKIEEAHVKITSAALPVVDGHPLLLSLLFHHLLDNAVKFRSKLAPSVQVNYTTGHARDIKYAEALKDTVYKTISFTDNGIGFDQQEAQHIFTMFHRLHDKSKYKGSGIGLAVCKKIMNMHNGFITAVSSPGKGATFSCHFPSA